MRNSRYLTRRFPLSGTRLPLAGFYSARSRKSPPLQRPTFAPPRTFDESDDWVVYCSHESSITLAGTLARIV